MHQSPFPVSFSSAFLKGILGRATAWEDLEEMAPEVARSLESVRDMDGGVEDLCLTFSVEEEESTLPAESLEDLEDDDEASENDDPEIWWSWRRLEQMPSDRPMLNRIAHWVRQQDHAHVSLWRSGSMHVDRVRTMLESEYRVDLGNRTGLADPSGRVCHGKDAGAAPARDEGEEGGRRGPDDIHGGREPWRSRDDDDDRCDDDANGDGARARGLQKNRHGFQQGQVRRSTPGTSWIASRNPRRSRRCDTACSEIVPLELLKHFTAPEFACLLGGVAAIDVHDWRANAGCDGYDEQSPQVRWLWRLVHSFTPDERTLLLKFCHREQQDAGGRLREPSRVRFGFVAVYGAANAAEFFERRRGARRGASGAYCLPTAATCFNTLRLPEYPTYEALEEAVTIALRHGVEGFAFG